MVPYFLFIVGNRGDLKKKKSAKRTGISSHSTNDLDLRSHEINDENELVPA